MNKIIKNLQNLFAIKKITVISFFTEDYLIHAANLINDCKRLSIKYHIKPYKPAKNHTWIDNCFYKIKFISDTYKSVKGPILWIDCDSRIDKYPNFLINADFDFGCFLRNFSNFNRKKIISEDRTIAPGILYFNHNHRVKRFIDELVDHSNKFNGVCTDDLILNSVFNKQDYLNFFPFSSDKVVLNREKKETSYFRIRTSGNAGFIADKLDTESDDNEFDIFFLKIFFKKLFDTTLLPLSNKQLINFLQSYNFNRYDICSVSKIIYRYNPLLAIDFLKKNDKDSKSGLIKETLVSFYIDLGDLNSAKLTLQKLKNVSLGYKNLASSRSYDIGNIERIHSKKNKSIKLFWAKTPYPGNFGDILSPYLIEKITGRVPLFDNTFSFLSTGSIIAFSHNKSIVWGSGSSYKDEILNPKSNYKLVRGPLTADLICTNGGKYESDIFADPGILLKYFYDKKYKIKNKFGLVLHYVHKDILFDKKYFHEIDILCSGNDGIENFINEIRSCSCIFSSSLHGIITAAAYNIPFVWITFKTSEKKLSGDDMKFYDFFKSLGIENIKCFDFSNFNMSEDQLSSITVDYSYKINYEEILKTFPFDELYI